MRIALIVLAIAGALSGCDDASIDRYFDSAQEHQDRLSCEMAHMEREYGGKMSAENAEAFCQKQKEMARAYNRSGS